MVMFREHELHKRRFGRNMGLGIVLAVFVALVFGLTVVKVTEIGEKDGFQGVTGTAVLPGEAQR
ncbi:hypothetical protein QCN27_12005 [Cereibacter sp. SYSU M97828]|nr:hypothetical protein [Cereibacter flavus]